jgi:lipopolysaccharide/colanic/teichoic acid biosynthesis glycosyltransferase
MPRWKRIFDLAAIVLAMPIAAPVMLVIAISIKLVSRGPVFYRQERIGYLGQSFICLKFRTMRPNASTEEHQTYFKQLMESEAPMTKMDVKGKGDPRLIPLGSLWRATGLDELPQLFNVIRGQMSLVGPRPCTPFEYGNYLSWQKERFNTSPGITGLWQVSGKNRTTFNQMIRLDISYAEKKSLLLDIKIILKTIPVILVQLKDVLLKTNLKKNDS